MTASGHDDSTLQLSPKSFAKVSGNICGVMKSSFLSPLKLPHSPHTRPVNLGSKVIYSLVPLSHVIVKPKPVSNTVKK